MRQEAGGRRCPACTTIILSGQSIEGVEIDRCGRCRGVWMDAGEFEPVRRWYARRGGTAKSAQREESSWLDYLGDAALQPDLIWEVAKVVGEVGSAGARTAAATAEGIVEFLGSGIDL